MKLEIRAAIQTDYPSIAAIHNATWADHPVLAEDLARVDSGRTRENYIERFMGVFENSSVAEGSVQFVSQDQMYLELNVLPEFQSRGFGRQFYDFLELEIERFNPASLLCYVREVHPFALDFVTTRGFREVLRTYHQTLRISSFNFALFEQINTNLELIGYSIKSFAELQEDPENEQKLHALHSAVDADVPRVHDWQAPSFEEFKTKNLSSPKMPKEACFIALKNGEWVGLTQSRLRPDPSQIHTGMTGVLREHRGHNLALALKTRAIQHAHDNGFLEFHANNASTNTPMLAINQKLGFIRSHAQIQLEKNL
jgi:GNAT superfamily N-acetyltransferase